MNYNFYTGNVYEILKTLPEVHNIVTSPPYFNKRKYGTNSNEIGNEKTSNEYLDNIVNILNSILLHSRGSLWINIGDTRISGELSLIPERFCIKMAERGWRLIDNVIWAKIFDDTDGTTEGNCMIEPAKNRLNGNGYENLYRFSKSLDPWVDTCAVRLPRQGTENIRYLPEQLMKTHTSIEGRSLHNVWRINMGQTKKQHYAVYPAVLCERPIAMTCPMRICKQCGHLRTRIFEMQEYNEGRTSSRIFGKYSTNTENMKEMSGRMDTGKTYIPKKPVTIGWTECEHKEWTSGIVLDPFCGTGTTGEVALNLGRDFIGIDLYQEYIDIATDRCKNAISNRLTFNPFELEK